MKELKRIIVYGIGFLGKAYVDKCISCGISEKNIQITDSNKQLWGKKYQNIEITNPDKVFSNEYDMVVISVGKRYQREVLWQLEEHYNVPVEKILYSSNQIILPEGNSCYVSNMQLIDIPDNIFGNKKYYGIWYELYKVALRGMNLGMGGGYRIQW